MDFYRSSDFQEVQRAIDLSSQLEMVETEELFDSRRKPRKHGFLCLKLFENNAWAQIKLPLPVIHPLGIERLAKRFSCSSAELKAVLLSRAWLEDGQIHLPPGHPGLDSPFGEMDLIKWPPPEGTRPLVESNVAEFYALWRKLGLDIDVLMADDHKWQRSEFLDDRTGWRAIQPYLDECKGFLVKHVPVPPPSDRPFEKRPGGMEVPGPFLDALIQLFIVAKRVERLLELNAPQIILDNQHQDLVKHFFELFLAYGQTRGKGKPITTLPAASGRPPTEEQLFPEPRNNQESQQVRRIVSLHEDRVLLDFPTQTIEMDLSGRVYQRWNSRHVGLVRCEQGIAEYVCPAFWSHHFYRLSDGSWLDELPSHQRFLITEILEQTHLIDLSSQTSVELTPVLDYLNSLVVSPCGRFLYAADKEDSGGVFSSDGQLQFVPGEASMARIDKLLRKDGRLVPMFEDGEAESFYEEFFNEDFSAFALDEENDTWRYVSGQLWAGMEAQFGFAFEVTAAAFDRSAQRLFLAGEDRLLVLTGLGNKEKPRIEQSVDLTALTELVKSC